MKSTNNDKKIELLCLKSFILEKEQHLFQLTEGKKREGKTTSVN